jgi:NAD(P)-dependent dehydrogenase (short-subunit alcohol dehydrogenase family)
VAGLDFGGQVVVVTGAGRGIGRAYARELARRGARIVVNDLGATRPADSDSEIDVAEATAREICDRGGEAVADRNTVATPEGGRAIVQTALDTWGRIDALICNAGIVRDATFAKMPSENLEAVVAVNLLSAFYVGQPAFQTMKAQGDGGRILFTSSASGLFGNFGQSNYGAAKMGIVGLSRTLAIEGTKNNIKVNVVAPWASSRMTRGVSDAAADRYESAGEQLAPEKIVPLAVVLCHSSCPSTGQTYQAGAGMFARVVIELTEGYVLKSGESAEDLLRNWTSVTSGPTREIANARGVAPFFAERLGIETFSA